MEANLVTGIYLLIKLMGLGESFKVPDVSNKHVVDTLITEAASVSFIRIKPNTSSKT